MTSPLWVIGFKRHRQRHLLTLYLFHWPTDFARDSLMLEFLNFCIFNKYWSLKIKLLQLSEFVLLNQFQKTNRFGSGLPDEHDLFEHNSTHNCDTIFSYLSPYFKYNAKWHAISADSVGHSDIDKNVMLVTEPLCFWYFSFWNSRTVRVKPK